MIIPVCMVRRTMYREGTSIAQGLMARQQQGRPWSSGLYPLPWRFVCSDSVNRPASPGRQLAA